MGVTKPWGPLPKALQSFGRIGPREKELVPGKSQEMGISRNKQFPLALRRNGRGNGFPNNGSF